MDNSSSQDTLTACKARLGGLSFIHFKTADLATVHYQIGRLVQPQVHKILDSWLGRLSIEGRNHEFENARRVHISLQEKIASPKVDARVRDALGEYLACLASWSQGAALGRLSRASRENLPLPSRAPSGLDLGLMLALMLQKEGAGCQTGLYRLSDRSVVLWHTEEDVEPEPGCRFDRLRLVTFPVLEEGKTVEITAFLYPDLLPGPTFSWRSDGYLQAVDTLFLKPARQDGALLANIATWVTLRLGGKIDPASVVAMLAPYWDGYALTCAWLGEGRAGEAGRIEPVLRIRAQTTEFAGESQHSSALSEKTGDFLFQVNLFSQGAARLAHEYEQISADRRRPFDERTRRTGQALQELEPEGQPLPSFYRLLCSRSGGEYAYANCDVKAHFAARLSPGGLEAWVGPGPALETSALHQIQIRV